MKNLFLKRSFDPLDVLMMVPVLSKYALGTGDIDIRFEDIMKNDVSQYTCSISAPYTSEITDLRNSIISFFCSYKYEYGKKTTLNTYIRKNYTLYKYKNKHSAQSSIARYKQKILKENKYLSDIFSDTFDRMKSAHSETLAEIDSKVLAHAVCCYADNPTLLTEKYTVDKLKAFISGTAFNNIDEYIFERIYHIKLICNIMSFYYEFKNFANDLSSEVFDGKQQIDTDRYKSFSISSVIPAIKQYWLENVVSIETLKERCMAKCRIFALNLCRFSLLDNVYTRTEDMKCLIHAAVPDIMNEEICLEKIKQYISYVLRSNIIADDVFYYSTIHYSLQEHMCRKFSEGDELKIVRELILTEDAAFKPDGGFLNPTISSFEENIKNPVFSLNLKESAENVTDED